MLFHLFDARRHEGLVDKRTMEFVFGRIADDQQGNLRKTFLGKNSIDLVLHLRLLLAHQNAGEARQVLGVGGRSEEHTSELQSLMRISYAVFCLKKKKNISHMQSTYSQLTNKI